MAPAPGLQLGLAPDEQLRDTIQAVINPPALMSIGLRVFEPADPAGLHLGTQVGPGVGRDPFAAATRPPYCPQGGQATGGVARPPALRLALAVAQRRRRLSHAARRTALQQPQQLHAIRRAPPPHRTFLRPQRIDGFRDAHAVVDPHPGLRENDPYSVNTFPTSASRNGMRWAIRPRRLSRV